MDAGTGFKALVVDDDDSVRRMIVRGLIQQGFACDTASDGIEAEAKVAQVEYDAVVTDLRMPNKHGHALTVHLLTIPNRPVIVVHTSVVEPKLAKDLLARGVDDILFKPFDFSILAAKLRALAERRRSSATMEKVEASMSDDVTPSLIQDADEFPVALDKLKSKLSGLSRILPISSAAFDVYSMTCADGYEAPQIAAAILRDASLAAEVLRLANCPFYNPSVQPITELERAVVRIGQKRIGEMALATNTLTALTSSMMPWLDVGLTWKRSMAAGLAVEMLVERGKHQHAEDGLLLSAVMYSLGRVVLGTLYPKHYEKMTDECRVTNESLIEQERRIYPINHAEVMACLLGMWKVPDVVRMPVQHVMSDEASMKQLPDQLRLKTELVKLAAYIGECAVGQWEPWDQVEAPPTELLKRLGIVRVLDMIERTRTDVALLAKFRINAPVTDERPTTASGRELAYCDLTDGSYDLFSGMTPCMGIKLIKYAEADLNDLEENVLVNCLGSATQRFIARSRSRLKRKLLIVSDSDRVEQYREYGQVIPLPASFSRLRAACWSASRPIRPALESLGTALSVMA